MSRSFSTGVYSCPESTFYDSWGKSPTLAAPPIGFDNAYYDGASNFYYLMKRYYDPNTVQFTTEDPRILATGQPWGYAGVANPSASGVSITTPMGIDQTQIYQFANDNPASKRDMTGLCGNCNVVNLLNNAFSDVSTMFAVTGLALTASAILFPEIALPLISLSESLDTMSMMVTVGTLPYSLAADNSTRSYTETALGAAGKFKKTMAVLGVQEMMQGPCR